MIMREKIERWNVHCDEPGCDSYERIVDADVLNVLVTDFELVELEALTHIAVAFGWTWRDAIEAAPGRPDRRRLWRCPTCTEKAKEVTDGRDAR